MIGLISRRMTFSSSSSHRSRTIRIVISLSLCCAALIVIISIMNALQGAQFDGIREAKSFDLEVDGRHGEDISRLLPDATVFEYGEGEALVEGGAYFVRYIGPDYDGGLSLALSGSGKLLIPYSQYLKTRTSPLQVSVLRKGKSGATVVKALEYEIGGVFYTRLGESFDSTMLFLPMEEGDDAVSWHTAVKDTSSGDKRVLEDSGYKVTTYLEKEKSLNSAFILEKGMMYVVIALLFLVIAVSLGQSVRVFLSSKRKELSELQVLGLGPRIIQLSVTLSFLLVLLFGMGGGVLLGLSLLPLVEKLTSTSMFLSMDLQVPWLPIVVYIVMMVVLTVTFVAFGEAKRRRKDIMEVLHGE